MKSLSWETLRRSFAAAGVVAAVTLMAVPAANAVVIYDSIPVGAALQTTTSWGYEATSTREFGDLVQFVPGPRSLTQVTVALSNFSNQSYTHPLTLRLFNIASGNNVGSVIAERTVNAFIPAPPG